MLNVRSLLELGIVGGPPNLFGTLLSIDMEYSDFIRQYPTSPLLLDI
jgi:hypothetical protein